MFGKDDALLPLESVHQLCHSMLVSTSLHFNAPDPSVLIDHAEMVQISTDWCQNDDFTRKTSVTEPISQGALLVTPSREESATRGFSQTARAMGGQTPDCLVHNDVDS
jgi:hypothetical protein